MKVSIIVAVSQNGVIGKDNDLIWHIPEDMKHFKSTTSGHVVISGRRNYDSIPERFRPLSNRHNIVITRNTTVAYPKNDNLHVVNSIEAALELGRKLETKGELFIIGGGQIYRQCLENDLVDFLYITHVMADFDGDTYFSDVDDAKWQMISEKHYPKSEKTEIAFSICKYKKKE